MKLAEKIVITLAGEVVELRPSLRHALRLERREGGFRQLLIDIREGSLSAAFDVIEPHSDDLVFLEHRILVELPRIQSALTEYVIACAGMDGEADNQGASQGGTRGTPRAFSDYLRDLYKAGTGWLGWTPDTTLDATPAEISAAFEGKMEMLKAIHGAAEIEEKPADDRPLEQKFRSIFASIGTVKELQPVATGDV